MTPAAMRGHASAALLRGASRSLAERGFSGTSARNVCELSGGANLRSIGYHFGSLHELLLTALSSNFREWMAPLVALLTQEQGSPEERLERGLAMLVAELPHRAPLVAAWLEAVALSCRDDDLRTRLAENRAGFRDALTRTLHEAGAQNPEELADAVMIVCDGLFTRFLLNGDVSHPRDIAATLSRDLDLLSAAAS